MIIVLKDGRRFLLGQVLKNIINESSVSYEEVQTLIEIALVLNNQGEQVFEDRRQFENIEYMEKILEEIDWIYEDLEWKDIEEFFKELQEVGR